MKAGEIDFWKLRILCCFPVIILLGILNRAQAQENDNSDPILEEMRHEEAPDFSLKSLDDKTFSLKDFKDKIVVIHIATTWCPFCNAEAPHLEKLYQDYKDKGVEVLIIDVKEPKELVERQLKEKHKLSFPILLDTNGEVAASYAPKDILPDLSRDEVMLASNIIIDREGKIQFMSLLDSRNFDAELVQLKKRLNELL